MKYSHAHSLIFLALSVKIWRSLSLRQIILEGLTSITARLFMMSGYVDILILLPRRYSDRRLVSKKCYR